MLPVGADNPVSPVSAADSSGALNLSTQSSGDPLAAQRDAMSSLAGVTVRLLASLPANLGQHLDAAV